MERFRVISAKAFEDVLAKLGAAIGHPDINLFRNDVAATGSYDELEDLVCRVVGPSGLMEFARFDLGEVLRKERGQDVPKSLRLSRSRRPSERRRKRRTPQQPLQDPDLPKKCCSRFESTASTL